MYDIIPVYRLPFVYDQWVRWDQSRYAYWNGYVCVAHNDARILLWDDREEKTSHILRHKGGGIRCISVWNDRLCSGCYDGIITVWNRDLDIVLTIKAHDDRILTLKEIGGYLYRPCLRLRYSGSHDTINKWNDSGQCISQFKIRGFRGRVLLWWNGYLCYDEFLLESGLCLIRGDGHNDKGYKADKSIYICCEEYIKKPVVWNGCLCFTCDRQNITLYDTDMNVTVLLKDSKSKIGSLLVRDDCLLVIYRDGVMIWGSGTPRDASRRSKQMTHTIPLQIASISIAGLLIKNTHIRTG